MQKVEQNLKAKGYPLRGLTEAASNIEWVFLSQ